MQLGVSHALIVRVLERMFDAQEAPFNGRRRKIVVQWIEAAVEAWVRELERRGGAGQGGKNGEGAMSSWVIELLCRCEESIVQILRGTRVLADVEELEGIRRKTTSLKRAVEAVVGTAREGSLFR
jgi:nuclear pore complex protein Nup155